MSDKRLLVKAVVFGSVCGLLVTVILLCIFSAVIMTSGLLPSEITNYITVGIVSLGALTGGVITSRITKSAGLIVGLITGFFIFMLITVIGVIKSDDSFTVLTLIRLISLIIAGGIGGILGLRKKERIHIK